MDIAGKIKNRVDGWVNFLTRAGMKNADPAATKAFAEDQPLQEQELSAVYSDDGLSKRAVRLVPEHATKRFCSLEGDNDSKVSDLFEELGVRDMFCEAGVQARLNGGAVVLVYVEDGIEDLTKPLNVKGCKEVVRFEIFDRWRAAPASYYPEGMNVGLPETYQLNRITGSVATAHESRVLVFDGEPTTARRRQLNNGFGDSFLQANLKPIRGVSSAFNSVETILDQFEVGVFTVDGLQNMIATGREEELVQRFEIMNISKSMLNAMILDTNEKFDRSSSSVTGLPDLIDRFLLMASATTGIPAKILYGQTTSGFGARDDADTRAFYDEVRLYQVNRFNRPLKRLIQIFGYCSNYGIDSKTIRQKWLPVWEPTEKESAETRKVQAETDKIYSVDIGALSADEIRENRFVSGYSFETSVETVEAPEPDENDIEEMNAPANNAETGAE